MYWRRGDYVPMKKQRINSKHHESISRNSALCKRFDDDGLNKWNQIKYSMRMISHKVIDI